MEECATPADINTVRYVVVCITPDGKVLRFTLRPVIVLICHSDMAVEGDGGVTN